MLGIYISKYMADPPEPTITPIDSHTPSLPIVCQGDQSPHPVSITTCENKCPSNKVRPLKNIMSSASSSGSPSRPATGKHPTYRGIRCRSGKWVSEIREPRKTTRIWLGTYQTPEMAAAAYDVAALALKGSDAVLNFPDNVSAYPVPEAPSPTAIRSAAGAAAALMKVGVGVNPIVDQQETGDTASECQQVPTTMPVDEFIDDEALFYMPNLLVDMAEGMLLSPPRINSPPEDDSPGNSDGESLWSYY